MSGTYNGGDFNAAASYNYDAGFQANGFYQTGTTTQTGGAVAPPPVAAAPPAATVTTQTITFVGVAPQTFRCTATGMKPSTQHWPYLLTLDVSSDCAPISGGSPYVQGGVLITDTNGHLIFDYFFKPTHSPFETRAVPGSSDQVAIIPVGQQAFKIASADGHSTASTFIESKPTT